MPEYLYDLQRTFGTLSTEFLRLIALSERSAAISTQEREKIREAAINVGAALVEVSALLVPAALRLGLDDTALRMARATLEMQRAIDRLRA